VELREIASRDPVDPQNDREKEARAQAIQRLHEKISAIAKASRDSQPSPEKREKELDEAESRGKESRDVRGRVERRKSEAANADRKPEPRREGSEASKDERELDERRAEIKRLSAEVEARRKALMEAQSNLDRAMKQMAGKEGGNRIITRNEHYEVRLNPTHSAPGSVMAREGLLKIVPRPDQEKRFAELEERLEKLQDEVKSLKKDAPSRR